jgi:hypothetical protein
MQDFQDRGDSLRQALRIDGTAGDAQDVNHPFTPDTPGVCLACGLAESYKRHHAAG